MTVPEESTSPRLEWAEGDLVMEQLGTLMLTVDDETVPWWDLRWPEDIDPVPILENELDGAPRFATDDDTVEQVMVQECGRWELRFENRRDLPAGTATAIVFGDLTIPLV